MIDQLEDTHDQVSKFKSYNKMHVQIQKIYQTTMAH
jgi:hypothetical protein